MKALSRPQSEDLRPVMTADTGPACASRLPRGKRAYVVTRLALRSRTQDRSSGRRIGFRRGCSQLLPDVQREEGDSASVGRSQDGPVQE